MKPDTDILFQMAAPYLDTRDNDVHVKMAHNYARQLLSYYPQADDNIVLPAIILHDVGWKTIPEKELLKSFGPSMKNNANQRRHETEGAKIADGILSSLGYPRGDIEEIIGIIDGHDTRLEALSQNDQLVKDADKLWRFSPTGMAIDCRRFGVSFEDRLSYLRKSVDQWLFTPQAREMATVELGRARKEYLAGI